MPHNNIINEVQKFAPMTFNELRDNLFENYEAGAISDDEMVQIFEQISVYLDLKTITNFAKVNGITYNGALKRRTHKITIDKVTFIINNF